ncbi:MAG: hypothetical protein A3K19_16655 [Lentisphaerae bacterium RIFOXYB12_FULL_65_16]|nr:MAG: hypothetical protein A3K18_20415 [Lentisphaerae bacterium RIFOXYA12_64_32]OGV89072.1 MAG: hypothetical protein A3K19_16655 [Lentisphaerae bacterium RIFOXYB12_FULL_65_16]
MQPTLQAKTQLLASTQVKPTGELAERIRRTAVRLGQDDVYRPEWIASDITFAYDPTPFHDWYTGHEWTWFADVSGRYLNAVVSLAPHSGGLTPKGKEVAELVFRNQATDGHFGPERSLESCDRSQVSGTAWMLLALPRYYALTGDERALQAARRLADWYAAITPYWLRPEIRGEQLEKGSYALVFSNFTHCLDGLAALYEVDPQPRYAELALQIARSVRSFDTEIHSHHFLASLRGMLDWHLLTGERFLVDRVAQEWGFIMEKGLLDTGGVPEAFNNPKTDEGCSEVDWVLVNLKLHQITGRYEYLEAAERAIHSHFFMNQAPGGGFGTWNGFHGQVGPMPPGSAGRFVEAFWCCSMHGPYGLAEVARHVYTTGADGIHVNLFLGASADIPVPGGHVRLLQTGMQYPFPGTVDLEVELQGTPEAQLQVRLPHHTPLKNATLDGLDLPPAPRGADTLPVAVRNAGRHVLRLQFAPSVRAEPCRRPDVFGERRSLWYGPMALGTNACPAHIVYRIDDATLAAMTPTPCNREGAFPSEIEFALPAGDAPDFAHTRDRRHITLYPLAAHGFRKLSYLVYLF